MWGDRTKRNGDIDQVNSFIVEESLEAVQKMVQEKAVPFPK